MSKVTAFEAKTRFGELLDRVSKGEEVVITRHDRPVARLIPESGVRQPQIDDAVRDLKSLRERIAQRPGFRKLTQKEIKSAIEQGRP